MSNPLHVLVFPPSIGLKRSKTQKRSTPTKMPKLKKNRLHYTPPSEKTNILSKVGQIFVGSHLCLWKDDVSWLAKWANYLYFSLTDYAFLFSGLFATQSEIPQLHILHLEGITKYKINLYFYTRTKQRITMHFWLDATAAHKMRNFSISIQSQYVFTAQWMPGTAKNEWIWLRCT